MDKQERIKKSIKDNKIIGTWNYMTSGKTIKDPTYLFSLRGSSQLYGDFDANFTHLDRIIYLTKGTSIMGQEKYKRDKQPIIDVWYIDIHKKLRRTSYQFTQKGWMLIEDTIIPRR